MGLNSGCFIARHGVYERGEMTPCCGRMTKAHLIRAQLLPKYLDKWDSRLWVWACWHHHECMDKSRTIRIPRSSIPQTTVELAESIGLGYWVDREYR